MGIHRNRMGMDGYRYGIEGLDGEAILDLRHARMARPARWRAGAVRLRRSEAVVLVGKVRGGKVKFDVGGRYSCGCWGSGGKADGSSGLWSVREAGPCSDVLAADVQSHQEGSKRSQGTVAQTTTHNHGQSCN